GDTVGVRAWAGAPELDQAYAVGGIWRTITAGLRARRQCVELRRSDRAVRSGDVRQGKEPRRARGTTAPRPFSRVARGSGDSFDEASRATRCYTVYHARDPARTLHRVQR